MGSGHTEAARPIEPRLLERLDDGPRRSSPERISLPDHHQCGDAHFSERRSEVVTQLRAKAFQSCGRASATAAKLQKIRCPARLRETSAKVTMLHAIQADAVPMTTK